MLALKKQVIGSGDSLLDVTTITASDYVPVQEGNATVTIVKDSLDATIDIYPQISVNTSDFSDVEDEYGITFYKTVPLADGTVSYLFSGITTGTFFRIRIDAGSATGNIAAYISA